MKKQKPKKNQRAKIYRTVRAHNSLFLLPISCRCAHPAFFSKFARASNGSLWAAVPPNRSIGKMAISQQPEVGSDRRLILHVDDCRALPAIPSDHRLRRYCHFTYWLVGGNHCSKTAAGRASKFRKKAGCAHLQEISNTSLPSKKKGAAKPFRTLSMWWFCKKRKLPRERGDLCAFDNAVSNSNILLAEE